jgi:hypothetical protein
MRFPITEYIRLVDNLLEKHLSGPKRQSLENIDRLGSAPQQMQTSAESSSLEEDAIISGVSSRR